jgi:electron transfer flavoprotein beta subunit
MPSPEERLMVPERNFNSGTYSIVNIVVCVKQTPDTRSVYIDPISGQVDEERFVLALNPADACAIEAAVRLKEQWGATITITALTLGPEDVGGALRAALAIGADQAVRLWNTQVDMWSPFMVAAALCGYMQQSLPTIDLVLCGNEASDWSSGIVGPALAEMLALPQVTGVSELTIVQSQAQSPDTNSYRLQVTRKLERGYRELLAVELPLLITVTAALNEPRYPSLPAHLAALQAAIPVLDPLPFISALSEEQFEETTLLEMHAPRPRPRRLAAPDSHHSAFERIGEIVSGGTSGHNTRLVEGSDEELAQTLVKFLREKEFV